MEGSSLAPTVAAEVELIAAKVYRVAATERPLDLARLRDLTAELQALIAEATSLERRAKGGQRAPTPDPKPAFFADEPAESSG